MLTPSVVLQKRMSCCLFATLGKKGWVVTEGRNLSVFLGLALAFAVIFSHSIYRLKSNPREPNKIQRRTASRERLIEE